MNNHHIKSSIHKAKGRVKEEIGHITGNNQMETEGIVERIKGNLEEGVAAVKDTAKKAVDFALGRK